MGWKGGALLLGRARHSVPFEYDLRGVALETLAEQPRVERHVVGHDPAVPADDHRAARIMHVCNGGRARVGSPDGQ